MDTYGQATGTTEAPPPYQNGEAELSQALQYTEVERPHYPAWVYDKNKKVKKPRKPSIKTFKNWIDQDKREWEGVLEEDARFLRFYRGTQVGVFDSELLKWEQHFGSPEPKIQIDTLCAIVSGIEIKIRAKSVTKEEQESARTKEHAARHILSLIEDQYALNGNGSFLYDAIWYFANFGRAAVLIMPDHNDPDFPFIVRLLNPSQVFVTQGADKYGLLRATVKERLTVQEVLDRYDPGGHNRLSAKLKSNKIDVEDLTREKDLNTVYTRWHTSTFYEDVQIESTTEHGQGVVPIIFIGHMAEPQTLTFPTIVSQRTKREIERGLAYDTGSNSRAYDLRYRFGRFLASAFDVVRAEEAILSLMMTQVQTDTVPPMVTESPYPEGAQPFDWRPGAQNPRRPGERDAPVTPPTRSGSAPILIQRMGNYLGKTLLPDQLFGVPDGQAVSGFHENALIASAKQRINPYIRDIEILVRMTLERCLYLFHGWCYLYMPDLDGKWVVPTGDVQSQAPPDLNAMLPIPTFPIMGERQPYPADVELSRETIEHCGTELQVVLHRLDWRELTTVANAVGMLMDKGLWSRERSMEAVDVEDVIVETQKIYADMAAKNPKFIEQVLIPQMTWQQDESSYLNWFITQQLPQLIQLAQQMQAMESGGAGPGGVPPPNVPGGGQLGGTAPPGMGAVPQPPSVAGVSTVQGDSQPAIMEAGSPGIPRRGPEPAMPMPIS